MTTWPQYQVPSLAGNIEDEMDETMKFDGMRGLSGLGDLAALQEAARLRAISSATERAKAAARFYATVNTARSRVGLPLLPGSVYEDLAARGVDPTTAPIRVPTGADGKPLKNKDGSYVVETITAQGPVPGVVVPGAGGGLPTIAKVVIGVAALGAVAVVLKKKFG